MVGSLGFVDFRDLSQNVSLFMTAHGLPTSLSASYVYDNRAVAQTQFTSSGIQFTAEVTDVSDTGFEITTRDGDCPSNVVSLCYALFDIVGGSMHTAVATTPTVDTVDWLVNGWDFLTKATWAYPTITINPGSQRVGFSKGIALAGAAGTKAAISMSSHSAQDFSRCRTLIRHPEFLTVLNVSSNTEAWRFLDVQQGRGEFRVLKADLHTVAAAERLVPYMVMGDRGGYRGLIANVGRMMRKG